MIKKILFFSGGIFVFLTGCIIYGVVLNLQDDPLAVEIKKKKIEKIKNVSIVIEKSKFKLNLYSDTILIKSYKAVFGRNNKPKLISGDKATPIGEYKICSIDSSTKYYLFFRFNYPNVKDLEDALRTDVITQQEFDKLIFEFHFGKCVTTPSAVTDQIGIHGIGKLNFMFKNLPFVYNWTEGSIAISDEAVDELKSIINIGTKIVIKK